LSWSLSASEKKLKNGEPLKISSAAFCWLKKTTSTAGGFL